MAEDIEALRQWILGCLIVASICTTLVPIVFAFVPWYRSVLGRLFMTQAISFAAVMDVTTLFHFWRPRAIIIFWTNASLLTLIAASTAALAWVIWELNYKTHQRKEVHHGRARK